LQAGRILELRIAGWSIRRIANAEGISERTVYNRIDELLAAHPLPLHA
jgi:DNA-binding Lrp family transcriptional regulator